MLRTASILGSRPFQLWRFLKLALVASLTQASFFSVAFAYPLQGAQLGLLSATGSKFSFTEPAPLAAAAVVVLVVAALAFVLAFTAAMVYLVCRLRVTLFALVIAQGRVREAWRRYPGANGRYFRVFLVATVAWWAMMLAALGPMLFAQARGVMAAGCHGRASALPAALGGQMLAIAAISWLLLPIWLVIDALLQDFLLPTLALEPEAGWRETATRVIDFVRSHLGQTLLFLILRIVFAALIGLVLILVELAVLGALALAGYGLGKLLWRALGSGGLGAHALFYAIAAALVLLLACAHVLATVAIYGVTGTFKTSYAAIFFAGDYPRLAFALDPALPAQDATVAAAPAIPPGLW